MKTKLIFLILLILLISCSQSKFVKETPKEIITCQMEVIASSEQEAIQKAVNTLCEYTRLMFIENNQNVVIKTKSCERVEGSDNRYLVIYIEEIY